MCPAPSIASARLAAERELRALDAVLATPDAAVPACASFARAWLALARLEAAIDGRASTLSAGSTEAQLVAEAAFGRWSSAPFARFAIACANDAPADPRVEPPTEAEIGRQRVAFGSWMRELDAEVARRFPASRPRSRALPVATCLGTALLVLGALTVRAPVWRVIYFSTPDLEIPASSALEASFGGAWGGAPQDLVPAQNFSDVWQSCLAIDADRDMTFTLGSDDGARLRIDGGVVIDDWQDHLFTERSGTAHLSRGEHLVTVEHYNRDGGSALTLSIMVDGRRHGLPRRWLRLPTARGECKS